ncbi:5625_t:CDS:2 [Cetraspora pellucida]|uniref:5625_t:CDS:1 n=1 Tax=Cetraspora pellucida TaxID=1433469 RepID=A0ACA9NPH2_9GLOM|nr:5625_t:CDS:2 [Cetraspora pellucida]
MANLPNELILRVLQEVLHETGFQALYKIRATCRKWKQLVPIIMIDELLRNKSYQRIFNLEVPIALFIKIRGWNQSLLSITMNQRLENFFGRFYPSRLYYDDVAKMICFLDEMTPSFQVINDILECFIFPFVINIMKDELSKIDGEKEFRRNDCVSIIVKKVSDNSFAVLKWSICERVVNKMLDANFVKKEKKAEE